MKHQENRRLEVFVRLRRSAGNMLMSALLAIALIGATTVGGVGVYRQYQTNQTATNRAAQIGIVLAAADKYARKNETAILNVQSVAGFANANSPTVAELNTGGFLTAGFSDAGQNGGPIKVNIRLEPTGCTGAKCQMAVSAYPTGSITDKQGLPDALMAAKIASALPNGSGWTNLPSDVTKLAKNSYTMPNPLGAVPALVVAQEWIGSNQASATVPPVSYETKTEADCTYGGSTTYQRSVTTDKWGAVTYGSWVYLTDSCAPPPPPTPPTPPQPPQPPQSPVGGGGSDPGGGGGGVGDPGGGGPPDTGVVDDGPHVCPHGEPNYPTCTFPPPPQTCIPGYGSTSAGEPGYCVDCDNVPWVRGAFASNHTAQQRACYLSYGAD